MAGRYLLDSNIVIALFAAEPGIQKRLSAAPEVFVSAVTVGELRYGADERRKIKAVQWSVQWFIPIIREVKESAPSRHWFIGVYRGLAAGQLPF